MRTEECEYELDALVFATGFYLGQGGMTTYRRKCDEVAANGYAGFFIG